MRKLCGVIALVVAMVCIGSQIKADNPLVGKTVTGPVYSTEYPPSVGDFVMSDVAMYWAGELNDTRKLLYCEWSLEYYVNTGPFGGWQWVVEATDEVITQDPYFQWGASLPNYGAGPGGLRLGRLRTRAGWLVGIEFRQSAWSTVQFAFYPEG